MDFANNVLFKSSGKKSTFLLCWHGRPYDDKVQSDLLDGTAFPASTLVACTEGPPHKENYTYFALCFYFLGKLTRPRLVHCAHAAILRRPHPLPCSLLPCSAWHVIAVSYTHAEAYALLCFHYYSAYMLR